MAEVVACVVCFVDEQYVKREVTSTQQRAEAEAEAVRAWVWNNTGAAPLPPLTRCKDPSFMVMGDTPLPDGACAWSSVSVCREGERKELPLRLLRLRRRSGCG